MARCVVHRRQGAPADFGVAGLAVLAVAGLRLVIEGGQQVEGDVGGLIAAGVGGRDVVAQRAERGGAGRGFERSAGGNAAAQRPASRPVAMDST
jgi:hypothetical protein